MSDFMVHPDHYNHPGRKECWDEMQDIFGKEFTAIWCAMTAYKYAYRAGTKYGNTELQDTSKMYNYIDKAKELKNGSVAANIAYHQLMEALGRE